MEKAQENQDINTEEIVETKSDKNEIVTETIDSAKKIITETRTKNCFTPSDSILASVSNAEIMLTYITEHGIDIKKGLELLGDMEMYNETLEDFLSMVAEKLNHLESYKSTDMPNYAILVHAMKSEAEYLGMHNFAKLCSLHQQKSQENDLVFVKNNFDN